MKQTTQKIDVGARVQVINQTLSGKDFIEGYATIKGYDPIPVNGQYYCSVQFDGESESYYRWIAQIIR